MNKLIQLGRMGAAYKRGREELNYPPYMLSIEATNLCNFKCKFCPQSDPQHAGRRAQGQLKSEGMKWFLERVVESGTANRKVSICLDGEPTVNPHLPEFISLINEYGFFPRFSSNGRLLKKQLAQALIEAGGFLASIDFASKAEYFDEIRGRKGDFEKVLENLRYLIDRARSNRAIKLEIVDTSVFCGADPVESLGAMTELLSNGQHLPRNVKTWTREFHNFCGHLEGVKKSDYRVCAYPWSQMAVTWDGFVVACCRDTTGRTVLGNVFEDPIMEIWNSIFYRELRRFLSQGQPEKVAACRRCDMPYSADSARWRPGRVIKSLWRR